MNEQRQQGSVLMVSLLVTSLVLLLGVIGFGIWSFGSRNDYKNNSDQKAAIAVSKAEADQKAKLEAEFVEREKSPVKTYHGPATYGTVSFNYPKTWSAYVDESGKNSNQLVDGFFYPNIVPSITGTDTAFALRVQVSSIAYEQELQRFNSLLKQGMVKATAYMPPKMAGVANVQPGVRLDGEIVPKKNGSMVIMKLRDKTVKVWTESPTFNADYTNIILASLTFVP